MKKDPRVYLAQILERIDRILEYPPSFPLWKNWKRKLRERRNRTAVDDGTFPQ